MRVVVKFKRGVAAADAAPGSDLGLQFQPLIRGGAEKLAALRSNVGDAAADVDTSVLDAYWFAEVPEGGDAEAIAAQLRERPDVELAYVQRPPPPPPQVDPSDDPEQVKQGYEKAAPLGIDAEYAWFVSGGTGAGVVIVDMEQGWDLTHDDLPPGIPMTGHNHAFFDHGTNVLGELVAVDNDKGVVGIAPHATARVTSLWFGPGPNDYHPDADVIVQAIGTMSFGDVLLVEAGTYLPNSTTLAGPSELDPASFDAIRLATSLGIVVIEAAYNSAIDLDAYVDPNKGHFLNRSHPDFRDSGAIMVGAASSAVPHVKLGFSNHGSRIDCYGWGENVTTTEPGPAYIDHFSGTSSASPIVAGAAILTQSMAAANLGFRFGPLQVRQILSDPANGTPSQNPAADRIGVMPDLKKIVTNVLHLVPDIYMRDFLGDIGDPHNGPLAKSPDIIVQPAADPTPQTTFGQGSINQNVDTLGGFVEDNHDNYVYVRVRNRGGSPATNVKATVYWSPPATLVTPNLWNLIGTAVLPSVPTGDQLMVSPEIVWPQNKVPGLGHYCFVGIIGTDNDPAPTPEDFQQWDNFLRFIRDVNNVTWCNFEVVDNQLDFVELPFLITGAPDRPRKMELVFDFRLPQRAEVVLHAPRELNAPLRKLLTYAFRDGRPVLALNPHARQRVASWTFPARMAAPARLLVKIPKEARENDYDVTVRQLYKDEEVGRITWRLSSKARPRKPRISLAEFIGKQAPRPLYL